MKLRLHHISLQVLIAGVVLLCSAALAQTPAHPRPQQSADRPKVVQPVSSPTVTQRVARPKYEVTGFRGARFGMTEHEVRASVRTSFGSKSNLKASYNPVEGTHLLTLRLKALEPAPGPAIITYIFGYHSKRLIQVNVIWEGRASKRTSDAEAFIAAGTRLVHYFEGYSWRDNAPRLGIPVGDNTVLLFLGEDEKKGAVRLVIDGVKYQLVREGKQTTSPEPNRPPRLIINYIADRERPDIARIKKGKF